VAGGAEVAHRCDEHRRTCRRQSGRTLVARVMQTPPMLIFVNLNSDEGTVNAVREPEPTHDMRKDSGRGRRTVNRTMNDVRIDDVS